MSSSSSPTITPNFDEPTTPSINSPIILNDWRTEIEVITFFPQFSSSTEAYKETYAYMSKKNLKVELKRVFEETRGTPLLEKVRERLLADEIITDDQSDVLKSFSDKFKRMDGPAARLLITIQLLPADAGLTDELRSEVVDILERYDFQLLIIEGINYWAETSADDLETFIDGARKLLEPRSQS